MSVLSMSVRHDVTHPAVLGGAPAEGSGAPHLVTVELLPLYLAAAVHQSPCHP